MTGDPRGIGYIPALDGLRALAVIAVLVFHGEMGASGGFLGVSVFFTLSGFLITSLLLAEHQRTGRLALRSFYGRRARRLIPASLACIAAVLAAGTWWSATQRRDLPGDAVASLANVANWRFAFSTTSYQDLFIGAPSPLAHFWSLAIEEQFYLVIPLIAVVCLHRSRRTFMVTTAVLLAGSIAATLLTSDRDLVYNGTHTRAAELLLGVLAAFVPARWWRTRLSGIVGWLGLAGLTVLIVRTDVGDAWLYRGGLVGVGVLSVMTIGGAMRVGWMPTVLAWRPLVAVGRISYGLYLFHWPIFLLMTPARMGLDGAALFVVRCSASVLAAVVSARLLEQPIRSRRVLTSPVAARRAGFAAQIVVVVAALSVVPAPGFSPTQELLAAGADGPIRFVDEEPVPLDVPEPTTTAPAPSTTSAPAPVQKVLVLGTDSSPVAPFRLAGYHVVDGVQPGCPLADVVEVKLGDGSVINTEQCERSEGRWRRLVEAEQPDIVVLAFGPIDDGLVRRADQVGFELTDGSGPVEQMTRLGERWDVVQQDLTAALDRALGSDAQILLYDSDRRGRAFDRMLDAIDLRSDRIDGIHETLGALLLAAAPQAETPSSRQKLLVIGDSTSLNLASALAAAGGEHFDVVWAGENACPFVRATAFRSNSDAEWVENTCRPFDAYLPALLEAEQPDAVVLAVYLRELSQQRYGDDPSPYVAGDPEYQQFHDDEMAELVGLLGEQKIPLLIADTPALREGAFASKEIADPQRVAAWNEQVYRWVDSWPSVDLLSMAGPIAEWEAANGQISEDGVHPEIERLTALATTVLVPSMLRQLEQLGAAGP